MASTALATACSDSAAQNAANAASSAGSSALPAWNAGAAATAAATSAAHAGNRQRVRRCGCLVMARRQFCWFVALRAGSPCLARKSKIFS